MEVVDGHGSRKGFQNVRISFAKGGVNVDDLQTAYALDKGDSRSTVFTDDGGLTGKAVTWILNRYIELMGQGAEKKKRKKIV